MSFFTKALSKFRKIAKVLVNVGNFIADFCNLVSTHLSAVQAARAAQASN